MPFLLNNFKFSRFRSFATKLEKTKGFFNYQPLTKFKQKYSLDVAYVYIISSYNNTLISLTDFLGNVLKNESCGSCNYKGRFKRKFIASKQAAENIVSFCKFQRIKRLVIILHGYGKGSEMVIRTIREKELKILDIKIKDKKPYNGCRQKKKRRI
uniref:Small ribosomal subunit protein uS11c n=1 Tax=Helicosporidium sp. subsp. Simulium jonesii TaxID=145475 RepID=RR11_HELSJ|nr:ribosomal protein S11 [Helicosporidium sp. ex Simulium jonesi]Q2EEW6.1 RecName: Full=Small ribosomal subunit protein uS11c; AltName: Full=Plastid 30S ribosomal protein S11 [Helicosporidium sp. ex Simulium jonesi]ABD33976.1 ribosomal protein S11 [Helicosporidium sp. ex Simulium jonesi]